MSKYLFIRKCGKFASYVTGLFVMMLILLSVASVQLKVWPTDYLVKQYIKMNTPLGYGADEVRKFISRKHYKIDLDINEPFDHDHRLSKKGDSYIKLRAYSYRFILDQDVQVVWVFERNILIDIVVWTEFDAP